MASDLKGHRAELLQHASHPTHHLECTVCGLRTQESYSDSLNSRENAWTAWRSLVDKNPACSGPRDAEGEPR